MKTAVRYYSRSGNTKLIAEAIAKAAGVPAVSTEDPAAALTERADVLFVGGALYAYGIDEHLQSYLKTLTPETVGRAVLFSTTWISKHSLELMRAALEANGVTVAAETFYVRGKPNAGKLREAEDFARKQL